MCIFNIFLNSTLIVYSSTVDTIDSLYFEKPTVTANTPTFSPPLPYPGLHLLGVCPQVNVLHGEVLRAGE